MTPKSASHKGAFVKALAQLLEYFWQSLPTDNAGRPQPTENLAVSRERGIPIG